MRRILVTGFEVFSNHSSNISQDLILALPEKILIDDPWKESRYYNLESQEIELEKEILTVDFNGSKRISKRIESGESWDAIIHLGLCESCLIPRVELVASNILDMKIPDNLGRLEKDAKIGDIDQKTTVEHEIIFSKSADQVFELSTDAGNYICNETYFYTLQALANKATNSRIPCLFLHLPSYDNITLDSCRILLSELMGRISFKPVMDVAAGVIIHDSMMLVARRNDKSHSGHWEFPGGKLNFRENASQAIVRELKEEFDWDVVSVEHLGNWFHFGDDCDIELNVQRCKFDGELPDFQNKEKWTSHDRIKWVRNYSEVGPYVGSDKEVAKVVSKLI